MKRIIAALLLLPALALAQVTTNPGVTGVPPPQSAVAITGGTINGATIGATTPTTGAFTTITESVGGAWTNYTPTITADTGTFTGVTINIARYRLLGKTLFIHFGVTATGVTGVPTQMRVTFPGGASGANATIVGYSFVYQNGVTRPGQISETATTYFSVAPLDGTAYSGLCQIQGGATFELI